MIIPTTESTLRMTLMQLSETKLELTAVTEQRDEMTLRWELTNDSLFDKRALADRLAEELKETKKHLKDANRGAEINAHALRINADKLISVTEQRDEWKAKFIQQNKDLGCEMMDPNGTIWDYAKKLQTELTAVTEQRDRLAEALELFLNRVQYTSAYMDGELRGGTFDYRSSGFDAEVKQAYQTIAAVKGGADEIPR